MVRTRDATGFVLEEITVTRGRATLLDKVSARLPTGQCTALAGASGAGKSSLLRLLNRLEDPTEGRVLLDSVPILDLDVLALRRRVGLVAQLSVLLTDRVDHELRVGNPNLTSSRLVELLDLVGLTADWSQRLTSELSGGETQRVCLARALAVEPEVLLLDEPTSALDGLNAALIADLARRHVASGGTVVLVSHDLAVVRSAADQVLVLDHGRLVASGRPDEVEYLEAR